MRKTLIVPCAMVLACAPLAVAEAHLLDEYLQATRIALERDRIVLEMSLTPGAALAEHVFALLDRDSDSQISGAEIDAYARTLLPDLVLELNGQPCPLKLARAESPAWHEMRDGLGTIRIEVEAEAVLGSGRHHLQFINRHRPDIGVYLVNALVPNAPIAVVGQRRDVLQRGIQLDIEVTRPYASASWIAAPVIALTALVVYRRRETHQGVTVQKE
jgi:hypothetical protein